MPKLYITQGLPASGKSTWALKLIEENPDIVRANRDTIRLAMFSDAHPWRPSLEKDVTLQERNIVETALDSGKSVIIDDTNLSTRTMNMWRDIQKKYSVSMHVEDFKHVPLQTCIERDALRTGKARVGAVVIQNMALRYGLITWPDKPIVLVDIDGTYANANHRLHHVRVKPKNWNAFFAEAINDPVNDIIHRWVLALKDTHCIVIVSGRACDKSQQITLDWLRAKDIKYDFIFMRNGYDYREDFIVKSEILQRLPKDRIAFSIDDRWQVVEKCWRAGGIKCYPVSETDGNY